MFRIISSDIDLFLIPTRATNWKDVRFCRIIVSKGIFVSMDQMDQVHINNMEFTEMILIELQVNKMVEQAVVAMMIGKFKFKPLRGFLYCSENL